MNAQNSIATGAGSERVQFHLTGRSVHLDPRIHAVRDDLADVSLAGILFAPHYAKAKPMHCAVPGAFLRGRNSAGVPAVSQLLEGETFQMLDVTGPWAWGFCDHDGYVGYIERAALDTGPIAATHRIATPLAPVFSEADIKSPVARNLAIGSRIAGSVEGDFILVEGGYIHVRHVASIDVPETDWVEVGLRYVGQPYVWGGRGHNGIDCSGLIQVALGQCGHSVPRDSDMQRHGMGELLADDEPLQRGDFVFFPGHVGMMVDSGNMLHANAYSMTTLVEPLADVVARLKPAHDKPVLARRRIKS